MPAFDVELGDDGDEPPLFSADDPLTFTLPNVEDDGKTLYHCVDKPPMPDDEHVKFDSQPRTYTINAMASNVVADERRKIRDHIGKLLDRELMGFDKLLDLMRWLSDQREAARQEQMKAKTRRPTGAR